MGAMALAPERTPSMIKKEGDDKADQRVKKTVHKRF